jgi:hypothetical protein
VTAVSDIVIQNHTMPLTVTKSPTKAQATKMSSNYAQMFEELSMRHKQFVIQKYLTSEYWSVPITSIPESKKKKAMKAAVNNGDDDEHKIFSTSEEPNEGGGGPGDGGGPGHDGGGKKS